MTGIKKDKYSAKVLQELAAAGAPEEILYLAKPHIGTDKLVTVVQNIRKKLLRSAGNIVSANVYAGWQLRKTGCGLSKSAGQTVRFTNSRRKN